MPIWRGTQAVTTVKCATGPVFHLLMKDGTLFSGANYSPFIYGT